jgi:hypothetical protein
VAPDAKKVHVVREAGEELMTRRYRRDLPQWYPGRNDPPAHKCDMEVEGRRTCPLAWLSGREQKLDLRKKIVTTPDSSR